MSPLLLSTLTVLCFDDLMNLANVVFAGVFYESVGL